MAWSSRTNHHRGNVSSKNNGEKKFIFLAAPSETLERDLYDAIRVAGIQTGFDNLLRVDELPIGKPITEEIRNTINRASLVIGEITERDPNVMWEIGYAQALNKPVLLITQDLGSVPFDLRSLRVLTYQPGVPNLGSVNRLIDAIVAVLREYGSATDNPGVYASPQISRHQVFFSYSHADSKYLDRMLIHLRPVERSGAIDLWSDTKIRAGDRWRDEIRKAVSAARVAVLLISADFLASEFIVTNELPPLLAAAEIEGARIIPVVVKPSRFLRDDSLSRFQALNDPRLPVIRMEEADREELYGKLAEVIENEIGL
jgi:hypothetical protein